ncbi:Ser/Thr protein kinase RdoA (MazF antagonist) [Paenibacillus mucilaginosus]|uniref:phosphotransferase enzyme family protein n=1 Tax=Paenibacillus mucilaginosus TaxID=61624 RepID=UPI003D214D94
MLQLKYLFNNEDLARMLLEYWKYDPDSLEMFRHYRISSNAIYPFRNEGGTQLLRFAPAEEKRKEQIAAELEFIAYLRENGYEALEPVPSREGGVLIEAATPWGGYFASVFRRVPGVPIHRTNFSDEVIAAHGKALGKLHRLSSRYSPLAAPRWSCFDVLDWVQAVLKAFPSKKAAAGEAARLREYFTGLPVRASNYGLIHYDFEYDNVFFDEASSVCHAIDFDDAMYHWYAMDIEQALHSLRDYIRPESFSQKKKQFIQGYLLEYELPEDWESVLPACRRFADLYGYARVLRASAERWRHEPEWMRQLRTQLSEVLRERAAGFGKALQ